MAPVTDSVRAETGRDAVKLSSPEDMRRARERVQTLLAEPLTEDTAVQVALLNNRGLQAAYNDLGISEAEYVQTSLPPNPALTLGRTFGSPGNFAEIGFQLVGNLLAIATLPRRTEIAKREFEEAQRQARAIDPRMELSREAAAAKAQAAALAREASLRSEPSGATQVSAATELEPTPRPDSIPPGPGRPGPGSAGTNPAEAAGNPPASGPGSPDRG